MEDKKFVRVRIVNEGQPAFMTKVTDVETGKDFAHVTRVDLTLDVHDVLPEVILTIARPLVDVIVDAEVRQVCPVCGRPVEQESEVIE